MVARLLDGSFPLYKSLIPVRPPHSIAFTDAFMADVKDCIKLHKGDPSLPLRITQIGADTLELRITGGRRPTIVKTPGTSSLDGTLAVATRFIVDTLTGTSCNTIGCVDKLKPAVIREPAPEYGTGAERIRLIMPVRVN